MKNTVIFSGTTEGRILAESFAAAGMPVTVCVATGYGEEVMRPDPLIRVHTGRMDTVAMKAFFYENATELVLDATHPYAAEVSANLREAAREAGIEYRRFERDTATHEDDFDVTYVKDTSEAVKVLEGLEGTVLLTTGSKELKDFLPVKDRLYVRVLPSVKAIGICESCGIANSHIIAEQGPFSYEENLAVMKRYGVSVMVTKESGKNGGYDEKIRAARAAGVRVIAIERPMAGTVPAEAERLSICVIGAGCGENTLTVQAVSEIRKADLIIGSERLLRYSVVKDNPCPKEKAYLPADIMEAIGKGEYSRVCVLFSGDTGFFSGAKKLLAALPEDAVVRVIPGISSVSAFAAAIRRPYDKASVISYHGRKPDRDEIIEAVRTHEDAFFLLSGREDVLFLADTVRGSYHDKTIYVGCDMGEVNEKICGISPDGVRDSLPDGKLYIADVSPKNDRELQ